MTFVPIVTATPTPPPSPRTRELAGLLSKVLAEYKKAHPAVTRREIRDATRIAITSLGPMRGSAVSVAAVAIGVAVMIGGVVGFLFQGGSGGLEESPAAPMIIVAVLVFLALLLVAVKALTR